MWAECLLNSGTLLNCTVNINVKANNRSNKALFKLCTAFSDWFQTRVFGYPNKLFFTAVSRCIHVTYIQAPNWFIAWWIINEFEKCLSEMAYMAGVVAWRLSLFLWAFLSVASKVSQITSVLVGLKKVRYFRKRPQVTSKDWNNYTI